VNFQIYNSLTRKKEVFNPIKNGKVSMYTCGPTVYDFSHIGNFRTFIFEDLLKRWLLHLGYKVKHVMNITDVDDKTIKKSIDLNLPLNKITNKYISHFMEDIAWLEIDPANLYPKATDYIKEMISMIQQLINNKMAYIADDNSVYFDILSFKSYGKLANINISKDFNNKFRVLKDEYNANAPKDFALWKSRKANDGDVFWESPWGQGRPGWHIECSAMSTKILGNHFDIHCGGVDNIFPHHENEIAQSVGSNGKKFVNYWVHSEHLMIDGNKMSKSKSNFFTIKDLKKKGFLPQSIRYQLLSGHYRTKISFSVEKKYESDKLIHRITNFYGILKKMGAAELIGAQLPDAYKHFKNSLNDDLDTPRALAIFLEWMKKTKKSLLEKKVDNYYLKSAWNFVCIFDSIFKFIQKEPNSISPEVNRLLIERDDARRKKNWVKADLIRDKIKEKGWIVEDTNEGQRIKAK
tara:strand:- start:169 stop:1560 length:1392 start_codon:yes stop_codon:yes gene_type:complete